MSSSCQWFSRLLSSVSCLGVDQRSQVQGLRGSNTQLWFVWPAKRICINRRVKNTAGMRHGRILG